MNHTHSIDVVIRELSLLVLSVWWLSLGVLSGIL